VSATAGNDTFALSAGDRNNDSLVDIISASDCDSTLALHLKNGNGTFATRVLSSTLGQPREMALADFNGDGTLDIAAVFAQGALVVFFNDGRADFVVSLVSGSVSGAFGVAAGDLDGDGDVDLLVTRPAVDTLNIFVNQGTGAGPAQFVATVFSSAMQGVQAVAVADLDRDGDLDVVVTLRTINTVLVLQNSGTGSFSPRSVGVVSNPFGVALGVRCCCVWLG
jgi:hypothetical protein